MGRKRIDVVTCDVCSKTEEFHKVKIDHVVLQVGDVRAVGDLCEEDQAPVREVLKILPKPRPSRRVRRQDVLLDE